MPLDIVTWAATNLIAPDAFSRLVNAINSNGAEYRRLRKLVHAETGIRPRRVYAKWLTSTKTWEYLISSPEDSYQKLVQELEDKLKQELHLPWRFPSSQQVHERAQKLVDATINNLIETLEAPRAIAAVGYRIQRDIQNLNSSLDIAFNLEELLKQLPPSVRDLMRVLYEQHSRIVVQLLEALGNKESHTKNVAELVSGEPEWLESAPARVWLAIGEVAEAHNCNSLASKLYQRTAQLGFSRGRMLARSALASYRAGDQEEANRLIEEAQNASQTDTFVSIASAAIDDNAERIVALHRDVRTVDEQLIGIVSEAVYISEGLDNGLHAYRAAVARMPEYAGLRLRLARLLLEASNQPSPNYGSNVRNQVYELAVEARDLRREWGGRSDDCVLLACEVAMARGDWHEVLKLGRVEPYGESTYAEASCSKIRRLTVEAAIEDGELDLAEELLASVDDSFDSEFLAAELLAATNDRLPDAASHYRRAWTFAKTSEDRFAVSFSLASIGESPPDYDELAACNSVESAIILAKFDSITDNVEAAINRLRIWRSKSPRVIELLVSIYMKNGQVSDAVDTLEAASIRFSDARFRARAAILLAQQEQFLEAEQHAISALASIGEEAEVRELLHEVLVAAAQHRRAWLEMAEWARIVIEEHGESDERRWTLLAALFNQRKYERAWNVLESDPPLKPSTEEEALAWVELHCRFKFEAKTAAEVLTLVRRFGSSPDFVAKAIGRYLIASRGVDLPNDLIHRWRDAIATFVEDNPAHPSFFAVSLPDDPGEALNTLREYLEPGTAEFDALCEQVSLGQLPYGSLSAQIGKTYTEALVHRAAGCIPLAYVGNDVSEQEISDAIRSLAGPIAVDVSVLSTIFYIKQFWSVFLGAASRFIIPQPAHGDIASACDALALDSEGVLSWNVEDDVPRVTDFNQDTANRLRTHSQWMKQVADECDVVDWPRVKRMPHHEKIGENNRFLPWLCAFDYALDQQRPFMADDVVLRAMARREGIPTFGTIAMLHALVHRGLLSQLQLVSALDEIKWQYGVDFSFDEGALDRIAKRDRWAPSAAAFHLSRPTSWRDGDRAYKFWFSMCESAASVDPKYLDGWLYWGILGAGQHKEFRQAKAVAALLVFSALTTTDSLGDRFAELLYVARKATAKLGLDDVLVETIEAMLESLTPDLGPAESARAVLSMASQLGDDDRTTVRNLVFGVTSV